MPQILSKAEPLSNSQADPDADFSALAVESPFAAEAATPPMPTTAGKTPEQLAKEAKIEALKNESLLVYCGSGSDDDFVREVMPYFSIFSILLIVAFCVNIKRKTDRTSRRSWLPDRC